MVHRRLRYISGHLAILSVFVLTGLLGLACGTDDGGGAENTSTTTPGGKACDTKVAVFFEPEISPAALTDAGATLAALDGVVHVDVLDHGEAAAEARRLFADDPSTLELLERAVGPNIRLEVVDASAQEHVAEAAQALPLVRRVIRSEAGSEAMVELFGDIAVRDWWCG